MATNLDPDSRFDSPATSILPRLPPLKVQVRAAEAGPTDEAEECTTPSSVEHRIPPVLTCPAAPRKPRTKPSASCKRAFPSDQLELFEVANRREVEDFFRSCRCDGAAVADVAKRRRFFCD
ncbi:cyclin-dependent protein kinase inhibitor SMR1 [Rhodamnia argentea]|uniref:Cyclin-dependent protein kinase inhibitor SMR1 n=1 Tax=Rhodamnia argentea TaxID=178133 RepID=A0A8B8QJR9_9MYRT|nr:cyclin-dependent protein kinase inhibitor SMR1 [Rhodamnia argentea]